MKTQSEIITEITEESMRALRDQENAGISDLASAYYRTQQDIIEKIRAAFPGETWSAAQMQTSKATELYLQVDQQLADLLRYSNNLTTDFNTEQLYGSMYQTAYGLDQATPEGYDTAVPALPVEQVRALVNTPFQGKMFSQRYGEITDEMAASIRGELTQSMINGESMDQAGVRISNLFGATEDGSAVTGYANRALTIARTEIMRAQNLGRDFVYDQNSDLMEGEPEWYATGDDKLCPWCLRRDGKTDEEISSEDPPKADPFQRSTTKPLHPRCRCTSVPRLKSWRDLGIDMPEGMGDDVRGMRNEDGDWVHADVETFNDWKSRRADLFAGNGDV